MQGPNNNIDGTFPEAMNHFWCSALNPHGCSYCKNTDTKMKVFNKRTQKEVIRPIRSILTPGGTIPLSSYPSPYIPTIILSHTCHSTTRLIFSPLTYNKRQFTIVNLPGNTPLGCGKSPEVTETCILQTESTSVKINQGPCISVCSIDLQWPRALVIAHADSTIFSRVVPLFLWIKEVVVSHWKYKFQAILMLLHPRSNHSGETLNWSTSMLISQPTST